MCAREVRQQAPVLDQLSRSAVCVWMGSQHTKRLGVFNGFHVERHRGVKPCGPRARLPGRCVQQPRPRAAGRRQSQLATQAAAGGARGTGTGVALGGVGGGRSPSRALASSCRRGRSPDNGWLKRV